MPRLLTTSPHASATVLRHCYVAACAGDAVGVMNVLRDACGADHAAAMIRWRVDRRWHWVASRGARAADMLLHAVRGDGVDSWSVADAEVRGAVWLDYCKSGVPQPMRHGAAPQALLPHFAQALPLCWQRVAARAGISPAQPASLWLTDAFHLTRREADVADLLASGSDPACIARTLGISLDTVRTHLKHVYRKTNTHSQCDVVRLMLALSARR
ncbi:MULTISPECIES: helix-turn-helix transcriptional regulator [Ralstonia]|jgi:DNA-binding CsgD family transcriptional regulator|uniref:Helix-turn-helix transcriptional regulator n=1 Tax=Ralstonia mojiangensis TaxID=2953895 RepID=A0ABT2LA26_9RALS|nr:helix-turn-helix transcriptional regulator [Ralstonia mojiangensis]MCO5414539.1 helix-turn-helix transcriptional regulator [Ralstonia mojiangensis]MCT7312270.1 helix-turn-helix transcriptional regulator [Ralstonia mojiangensis]MCT7327227.1 helix-turn-helix transcriptional regulator [Ralstonia mojiangensis]